MNTTEWSSRAETSPFSRGWRVPVVIVASAIVVLASLIGAPVASAHTDLVASSPADGAVLDAMPAEVVFTFNEDLLSGTGSISIFDDAGTVLAKASVEPRGAVIRMAVPPTISPGSLHAAYRVASADGHPVSGEISFTVRGAPKSNESARPSSPMRASASAGAVSSAAPQASPPADAERSREEGRASANFSIALGVVLVALAVALYVKRRRQAKG